MVIPKNMGITAQEAMDGVTDLMRNVRLQKENKNRLVRLSIADEEVARRTAFIGLMKGGEDLKGLSAKELMTELERAIEINTKVDMRNTYLWDVPVMGFIEDLLKEALEFDKEDITGIPTKDLEATLKQREGSPDGCFLYVEVDWRHTGIVWFKAETIESELKRRADALYRGNNDRTHEGTTGI